MTLGTHSSQACLTSVIASFPLPPSGDGTAKPACPILLSSLLSSAPDVPEKPMQRLCRRRANTVRIATHLKALEQHDTRRVIVAKRIARLGLGNDKVLRKHFEAYGPVTDVFLANTPLGALLGPGGVGGGHHEDTRTRFRPSGMAHVLMDEAADAERIFAEGDEVSIGGVAVLISRFWRRAAPQDDEGDVDGAAFSL